MAVDEAPLHNDWLAMALKTGIGFTRITKLTGVPVQVFPSVV